MLNLRALLLQKTNTDAVGWALVWPENNCDTCSFKVSTAFLFYFIYWFYGQIMFITMFLTIILDAFAVEEFMEQEVQEDDDKQLNRKDSIAFIAKFQCLPVSEVSVKLVALAWQKLSTQGKGGQTISRNKLLILIRIVQPMTKWRLAKGLGLVWVRMSLRQTILFPVYIFYRKIGSTWLQPYPGDDDYVKAEVLESTVSEGEARLLVSEKCLAC